MSKTKIEYKRFSRRWINDVKEYFDRVWKRCMADVDLDDMNFEDIKLLQETSKMYKSILDESKEYIDVMNYQVRLLEDVEYKLIDMNERLEKIERKMN